MWDVPVSVLEGNSNRNAVVAKTDTHTTDTRHRSCYKATPNSNLNETNNKMKMKMKSKTNEKSQTNRQQQ